MASNARKHVVPAGPDSAVTRATIFETFGNSIRDVVPVANTTGRTQLVGDLTAAGEAPSATKPLYVYRADAPGLHRTEVTIDGSVWLPVDGVLQFADKAAADAWAIANGALLTAGDIARIGTITYMWTGSVWWQATPGRNLIRSVDYNAAGSVNVDGVFTSMFTNYEIINNVYSAVGDGGCSFQFRAAGANVGTAALSGHYYESAVSIAETKADQGVAAATIQMGRYAAAGGLLELLLLNPGAARTKRWVMRSFDNAGYQRRGGGMSSATASYDGFVLTFPAAATGRVTVYGLA